MTVRERNALVRRAMELHDPMLRNGYYAGLAATIGRRDMDRVRRMADHRLAGGTDAIEVIDLLAEAASHAVEAVRIFGRSLAEAFRGMAQ